MDQSFPLKQIEKYQGWQEAFRPDELKTKFLVNFHGIPVCFHLGSQELKEELELYFPQSWQQNVPAPVSNIYWSGPERMTGQNEIWLDVPNPSCIFSNKNVYQRDFCAQIVATDKVQLLAEEKINDGFFNFLRFFLPQKLLRLKKILLHSSCLIDEQDQAYLFLGYSGAGKTTVTQLAKGAKVLGDDMNLLSIEGRQVIIEPALVGQSFSDKQFFGQRFPVKGAFWLVKSDQLKFVPIKQLKLNHFMASFSGLFWDQMSQLEYNQVFTIIEKLNGLLQLHELHFSLQDEVWDAVRKFAKDI